MTAPAGALDRDRAARGARVDAAVDVADRRSSRPRCAGRRLPPLDFSRMLPPEVVAITGPLIAASEIAPPEVRASTLPSRSSTDDRAARGHHVGVEAARQLDLDLGAAEAEVEEPPGTQPLELDAHDVAALRDVDPVVLADLLLVVGAAGDHDPGARALVGRDRDRGALGLDLEAAAGRDLEALFDAGGSGGAGGEAESDSDHGPEGEEARDLDHRGEAQDGEADGLQAVLRLRSWRPPSSGSLSLRRRAAKVTASSGGARSGPANHSRSLVVRRSPRPPRTAIWSARRSPTRTTSRLPRVMPV